MEYNFYAFVLAAMLGIIPKESAQVEANAGYIREFAVSIATAIHDNPHEIVWTGSAEEELFATLHIATAWGESRFDKRVQNCELKGDKGMSITSYQIMKPWALQRYTLVTMNHVLSDGRVRKTTEWRWMNHHTQKQICMDPRLAAEQAMHIIAMYKRKSSFLTPHSLFQVYATGSPNKRVKRITGRCMRWAQLAMKMGMSDARNGKNVSISCWRSPQEVVEKHPGAFVESINRIFENSRFEP